MDAWYFDGRSTRRHEVKLIAAPGLLTVQGEGWLRAEPLSGVQVSEPSGRAPRTLRFADGAYCEVLQGNVLNELLARLGFSESRVVRWQGSWRYAAAGMALLAAVLGVTYFWGLPWVAEKVAAWIPRAAVVEMSDQLMRAFDGRVLSASHVPQERRARIEAAFEQWVASDPALTGSRLQWRRSPQIGPNAFALPDGRVVLLDELVALAGSDEEILGVLAHELGHVRHRHGLRQTIQSSVVSVVVASYLNDFSSVLSGMGSLLLQSNYSREFELEADDYSAVLMNRSGNSPEALITMLARLERATQVEQDSGDWLAGWVSSHPEVQERIARLRARRIRVP